MSRVIAASENMSAGLWGSAGGSKEEDGMGLL